MDFLITEIRVQFCILKGTSYKSPLEGKFAGYIFRCFANE